MRFGWAAHPDEVPLEFAEQDAPAFELTEPGYRDGAELPAAPQVGQPVSAVFLGDVAQ